MFTIRKIDRLESDLRWPWLYGVLEGWKGKGRSMMLKSSLARIIAERECSYSKEFLTGE